MATARVGGRLAATCLLLGSITATPALAQNYADRIPGILSYRPRQEGANFSTPTPEEAKACTVELIKGTAPKSSGWLLKDPQGRPLRKIFDRNGDRQPDTWSYYKDGVEVYREVAVGSQSNPDDLPKVPNHFRWLNTGGSKWGIDLNRDGRISYWAIISPEEVAQEAFQAVITGNYARLQALFVSEAELRALKVPQAEISRILELQKQAPSKFQNTLQKVGNVGKAVFERVESGPPQTTPSDANEPDLIKYASRSILYENAGKHDWLQTGEMIQVGRATWRLVEAPVPGDIVAPQQQASANPEMDKLLEQISALDAKSPAADAAQAEVLRYTRERIALLQRLLPKLSETKDRETWTKQLADNLSTLAQADDKAARQQLDAMKDEITRTMPGTNLAGYVAYRVLWTDYAPRLTDAKDTKAADQWMAELVKFVQTYPKADDTPDCLQQLGVGCEFAGKDDEARRWYQQLVSNFPNDSVTPKAAGAAKRLELVGKPMELSATTLTGSTFDLRSLSGKVVVVYYWASTCKVCTGDFARIKQMLTTQGPKGMELVTINLDEHPEEAAKYFQATPIPGTHLGQPAATGQASGLNGPLAIQYGINGLPTMFLVGKDGKVISTKMQINDLEEAVRKAL